MNTFLLINPLSGSYSPTLRSRLQAQLSAAGIAPKVMTVTGPQDAVTVCSEIETSSDNPLIIVAGGDGTINAVVNALQPGFATLAILPIGTANVLAHELGISSVSDGIRRIAAGHSEPLAVGVIAPAEGSVSRFILMAGIGLDGSIVKGVRTWEKRTLKKGAYLLSALRCLISWDRSRFVLRADEHELECHSVIISNAARYGGNFILFPDADLSQPLLELFCITSTSRWSYLMIMLASLAGCTCRREDVTRLCAAQIELHGTCPIQLDGDYYGQAPVRVSTIADFARIIV
jgi:YegS/Rv2252/BmrU family lipid kinase